FCTIGRSADCLVRLPGNQASLTASRRHCLLDIDPPAVRVRDLGSLNGTYVNGRKVGQRARGTRPLETVPAEAGEVELHDGDRLAVGDSEFVLGIETCAGNDKGEGLLGRADERGPGGADGPAGRMDPARAGTV